MSRRGVDRLIALAIFAGVLAVTLAASRHQGVHRDEAYYMDAGEQYIGWWERFVKLDLDAPFSDKTIKRYWDYNHEHPPLMKVLYGLSWRIFHDCDCAAEQKWHAGASVLRKGRHLGIPILDEQTAFRLPTMICFALLCALVYLFFVDAFGKSAPAGGRFGGLAAALLMASQPRAFFHAQTASFDLPAAMLWFATTYVYWRTLRSGPSGRPVRALLAVGAIYGLFLATKLQSFFLPVALGFHFFLVEIDRARRHDRRAVQPFGLLGLVTVGPLVFFALWPWLWHDTFRRFASYVGFHWNHVHYNFEYLGRNYNEPPYPIHEPVGMLVTTAPVILLVLAAIGAVLLARLGLRSLKKGALDVDTRRTGLLLAVSGFVPVAPFFLGSTPIFGETKHWLATMPVLAMAAGFAVQTIGARLTVELSLKRGGASTVMAALVALAFVPAAIETAHSHPYGLSHYNALAGGPPGGADLGMNRQFWGYSVRGLLPWFNETLPRGSKIYLHDWNEDAYQMYLRDGQLRPDLQATDLEMPGIRASDTALVIHEKHFNKYEYMIWDAYGTVRPVRALTFDGVPLVTVYRRGAAP
jgi:hypothetical protein